MALYQFKIFKQVAGSPLLGHPGESFEFEAQSHDAARSVAERRLAELPRAFIATLSDEDGKQIWAGGGSKGS
jgi:hypothetical protein